MNWEETIQYINTQPEYKELVQFAYLDKDLPLNVERFRKSDEYNETKILLSEYIKLDSSTKLLDIGSGNGISCTAFAMDGINVVSVEPDPSETVGAGAIRQLKELCHLPNLEIHQGYAEELKFNDQSFDIVYTRQCMHHAYDLNRFVNECSRVLKKGGILITVRDHVVFSPSDKQWFLDTHPLQKYYGGENAFSPEEYKNAFLSAGLTIQRTLTHFDSVINYFPLDPKEKENNEKKSEEFIESLARKKLGILSRIAWIKNRAIKYMKNKTGKVYDEKQIPGRMYTFLATKN